MSDSNAKAFGAKLIPVLERAIELTEEVEDYQEQIEELEDAAHDTITESAEGFYSLQKMNGATYRGGLYGRYGNTLEDKRPDLPNVGFNSINDVDDVLLNVDRYSGPNRVFLGFLIPSIIILSVGIFFFFLMKKIDLLLLLKIDLPLLLRLFPIIIAAFLCTVFVLIGFSKRKQRYNSIEQMERVYRDSKSSAYRNMQRAGELRQYEAKCQDELNKVLAIGMIPEDYTNLFALKALRHVLRNDLASNMREALQLCGQMAFQNSIQTAMDEMAEQIEESVNKLDVIDANIVALGESMGAAMNKLSKQMAYNNVMATMTAINTRRTAINTRKTAKNTRKTAKRTRKIARRM